MRLVILFVLALGIAPAYAQDAEPTPLNSLTQKEIEREQQQQRWSGPSGFWTSPHKSEHGAYRYRMLGIGVILLLITGYGTWRLIKRANTERAART